MNEFLNFMISREHLWVPLCHIWMRYFAVWSFLVWFIFHWCVSSAWVISHSWVLSVKQFSCILFVPLKLLCLLPVKEQYLHSFHFFFSVDPVCWFAMDAFYGDCITLQFLYTVCYLGPVKQNVTTSFLRSSTLWILPTRQDSQFQGLLSQPVCT